MSGSESFRSFPEATKLFVAYADRVAGLTPSAWDRIRLRCVELDDPAFHALLLRTRLAAKAQALPHVRPEVEERLGLRMIRGASAAIQLSTAFIQQVVAEFEAAGPEPVAPTHPSTEGTDRTVMNRFLDANKLLESVLLPHRRTNPGVVTAVRAAGQAVFRRGWMAQADFDAVYGLIEPDIPFAELTQ